MTYRAVVFDFDYTLGESTDGIVSNANTAFERMGLPKRSVDEVRVTIGHPVDVAYSMMTGDSDPGRMALFKKHFVDAALAVPVDPARMYPEAVRAVKQLSHRGYSLGIVTTKYSSRTWPIMERYGVRRFIDEIIGSDDVKTPKPDPEGLLMMSERLGVPMDQILYVGDTLVDEQAASAAGCDFVAVLTGFGPEGRFDGKRCRAVIPDMSHLIETMGL